MVYPTFEQGARFIAFYGGGVLDLGTIKCVIEHVEREGYGYMYGIVTNGTLLRKEIVEYLKAHIVLLTISMDGSRLINDLNRVEKGGKGTFGDLKSSIKRYLGTGYIWQKSYKTTICPFTTYLTITMAMQRVVT